MLQFNLRQWHLPRSSTASLARSLSGLANRAFNVTADSVGTIKYVTLGYPPRCTEQQLTKELRWSGNVSSANIPMLTVPWRTSPFLTHVKLKHPWRIQPWNKTCRHKSLLTPLTTLLRRVPYRGRRSWFQPWGTPTTQERKGPTVPSSGSAPCAKKTMGVKLQ